MRVRDYARKHAQWTDFTDVPRTANQPFTRFGAAGYGALPTVSFVSPDLCHDMHHCPVGTGDAWLRAHLRGYARAALPDHLGLAPLWLTANDAGRPDRSGDPSGTTGSIPDPSQSADGF